MPITKIIKNKTIKIKKLTPYEKNPRIHSEKEIDALCRYMKSLESPEGEKTGFINQVIVDENGMILAGHKRVLAAEKIGYETVDCRIIHGLTDAEKKAYVIADNKHTMIGAWDHDILREELIDINQEIDLEFLGFDNHELKIYDIPLDDIDNEDSNAVNAKDESSNDLDSSNEEIDIDEFSDFKHKCPKCQFEWN